MPVSGVTFYLRGDSLTARYAKGDNRHAFGLQASGPSPSKAIVVAADAAAIGGQIINIGNPSASIALLYAGRENCPNTQRFTAIMRCKIFSANGAVGMWGMGSFGLIGAPNFSSGVFNGGFRTRAATTYGFIPINTADLSYAASPPNVTGASYNDIVWKYSRASGAGACEIIVNGTSIGSYTAANNYELPIDQRAWASIQFGMNSVFNTNDIYLNEFALIEGDINVNSIALESGTGALNGSSRTSFLDIPSYSGITWPTASKVRSDQAWNEYSVAKTGTLTIPATTNVKSGIQYGDAGTGSTGSLLSTDPGAENVVEGIEYTIESVDWVGGYTVPESIDPGVENVLDGTSYKINDVPLVGTFDPNLNFETMRQFLNDIFREIGVTSLTDEEYATTTHLADDYVYSSEVYAALDAILVTRGDVNSDRQKLEYYFLAKGTELTAEPEAQIKTEILMGIGLDETPNTSTGKSNLFIGGALE